MKANYIFTIFLAAFVPFSGSFSQPQLKLVPFSSGFVKPADIVNAGDGRLFIVEQAGDIRILDSSGQTKSLPFLDIHDRVKSAATEQGLLGLAFHPDYPSNGYFYVDYTGVGDSSHISRFSVSASNPDSAEPSSEFRLLTIYKPFQNHNGGDLHFGPDGFLYIGPGDGGGAGDPDNRSQDLTQLYGKLLRIDVDHGDPYSIPSDNPFAASLSDRGEIWAYGLRNPWRFSFDRQKGDLFIADVGQDTYEEIDFQPANSTGGQNYGWRCYEGDTAYNLSGCNGSSYYTFPVHVYHHDETEPCNSETGGYIYRGSLFPGMNGRYFFADYCVDKIWSITDSSGTWSTTFQGSFPGNGFSTFGEDKEGELYIAGHSSGTIYHLTDTAAAGITAQSGNRNIRIYPNPFISEIHIVSDKNIKYDRVVLSDLEGKVLLSSGNYSGLTTLNVSYLLPGMYLLRISTKDGYSFYKLIKE